MKKVSLLVCVLLFSSCAVQQPSGSAAGKVYTIPESEMAQYQERFNQPAKKEKTAPQKAKRSGAGDGPSVAGKTIPSTTNGQTVQWRFTDDKVTMIGEKRTLRGDYEQRGKNLYFNITGKKIAAVYDGRKITFAAEKKRPAADYTQYQKPYADDCVMHEGYYRCWYIHVPETLNSAAPLLVDMHGFGGNPERQRMLTGFDRLADEEKFIVVWPLGMNASWNAGPLCCGHSVKDNVDDVGFLRKMIARVSGEQNIDQRRIYVTGLSNGSGMSQRFANEASDLVAATASLALYLLVPKSETYSPVPMLEIHGTKDSVVNFEGAGTFPGAIRNLETWAAMNQCSGEAVESWREGPHYALTYEDCQQGAEVTLVTIHEGGHVIYPSQGSRINTTGMAWDFMKRFSK
ncbi:MAG: hypothetical protein P8J55_11455 [Pseudomonadales bacterium]|nr:hypothetical protein [Pseudomonadales bacterium]